MLLAEAHHPVGEFLSLYEQVLDRDDIRAALAKADESPQDDVLPTEAHRNLIACLQLTDSQADIALAAFCVERNLASAGRAIARYGADSSAWPAFVEAHFPVWASWQADDVLQAVADAGALGPAVVRGLRSQAAELQQALYVSTRPVRVWEHVVLAGRLVRANDLLLMEPAHIVPQERQLRDAGCRAARDVIDRILDKICDFAYKTNDNPQDERQLALDRLDAGTLSALARSVSSDDNRPLNERFWATDVVRNHALAIAATVGRYPNAVIVATVDSRWLTVGNAGSPTSASELGVHALARPYAVLVRPESLEESLTLAELGQLDPTLLHELVHVTQQERGCPGRRGTSW